jgi:fermentation-respiration switch protein FrsA (DUF1100 family)
VPLSRPGNSSRRSVQDPAATSPGAERADRGQAHAYEQQSPNLPDLSSARGVLADALITALTRKPAEITVNILPEYQLSQLEVEAIHVMREVVAVLERPALLFAGGKDSITCLRVGEKAFWPARIPFPVLHVDTGHNFREVLEFRDKAGRRTGGAAARRIGSGSNRPEPGSRGAEGLPQPDPDAGSVGGG